MSKIGQALTGQRASTPSVTKVSGDKKSTVVYRNLGNNHSHPFFWGDQITVASGATTAVVASGIKFHGFDVATYGNITATPEGDLGYCYLSKDTVNNVVTLVCSSAASADTPVNVHVYLGVSPDLTSWSCRGNTDAAPSLP